MSLYSSKKFMQSLYKYVQHLFYYFSCKQLYFWLEIKNDHDKKIKSCNFLGW